MAGVEVVVDSVRRGTLKNSWAVILKEKTKERYLPVYIGSSQADEIKRELVSELSSGLTDYDLSLPGINAVSPRLESVIINRFTNGIFYAKLSLIQHDKSYEVDCSPAKALTLGVKAEVPIFVDEAVLSKAAIAVKA